MGTSKCKATDVEKANIRGWNADVLQLLSTTGAGFNTLFEIPGKFNLEPLLMQLRNYVRNDAT